MQAARLLICTDLDRTLIPNGPQPESPGARERFYRLAQLPQVTLTYVSGRHRALVQQAIANYRLPPPDFVIGDVGTTIYHVGGALDWQRQTDWEEQIARDWAGHSRADIKSLLVDLPALRMQESSKQNAYKLSYYVPLHYDQAALSKRIRERLDAHGIAARQIWSVDEPAGVGMLDVTPASASKYHAIMALMQMLEFDASDTLFCGDSGNDLEVLVSPLRAVLVANARDKMRDETLRLAQLGGNADRLYIARGGYQGMNGNYSAGMLEGIAHYFPLVEQWLDEPSKEYRS
ncbi:MAG: HAD-IIB family hydrolase [Chromatiaceae bacterium]|nr:HAD-IIB family hydrolase [Gammaproteobacteria bacterium]MCP5300835.1 HAD-IIB family hydrolase [Chromatiaceae bacterium]MCP5421692.1 HAD-IIB family hydrolase [Chromatiaceae bacterium]